MADKTGIEWTDATWNPVTGCTKVSPGCDHCYAETLAERFRGTPGHYYENGFDVQLRPDKLDLPLRWTKPRRVFVNSMSDLFHDSVPDEYIANVFAVMALAPQHTFQVLTKRHGRMRSLVSSDLYDLMRRHLDDEPYRDRLAGRRIAWPLPNVWLGVSVEDQKRADLRVPALCDTPAAVRFLSCEPLLGPVDLTDLNCKPGQVADAISPCDCDFDYGECRCGGRVDWVIVGGESGRGARPMHPAWARALRDQCVNAGVPFHFKQWGNWRWAREADDRAYEEEHGDQFEQPWQTLYLDGTMPESNVPISGAATMQLVGKKAAGRELDGRTWDEIPQAVTL